MKNVTGFDKDYSKSNNPLYQHIFDEKIQKHTFAYIIKNDNYFEVVIQTGFSLDHSERFRTYAEAFDRCSQVNI